MAKKKIVKPQPKLKKGATNKPTKNAIKKKPAKKKTVKPKKGKDKVDLECFLSTACIQHKNLPDNCNELTLLRRFRDEYMKQSPLGKELVEEYYQVGPALVNAIEQDKNKKGTYSYIYSCIQNACTKIILKQNLKAQVVYIKMVENLLQKYRIKLS